MFQETRIIYYFRYFDQKIMKFFKRKTSMIQFVLFDTYIEDHSLELFINI
jgi:hypothetical protein